MGIDFNSNRSLTLELRGVGGQSYALAALPSGERPGTNCAQGYVGPKVRLNGCGKLRPHWESNPDRKARSVSPYQYAIHTFKLKWQVNQLCSYSSH